MHQRWLIYPAAIILSAGVAHAQETLGAGRVEIDSALLGGGVLVLPADQSHARGYVFDLATTVNVLPRVGLEADFAWAMGRSRTLALPGSPLQTLETPGMLFYTGNIIYNPRGHEHALVPYAELGWGAASVLDAPDTFGLESNSTHLVANVGGGLRWFIVPHWGARADYRYIAIPNGHAAAGVTPIRHAQRLYGALVFTF
jgi:hypothetical protein